MNKRMLNRLAKAGYFNSVNGALYAATKHTLRKALKAGYLQMAVTTDQEVWSSLEAS